MSTSVFVPILRRHLEPTLDMLEACIRDCPSEHWNAPAPTAPVWEHLYHALFWLVAWLRDWDTPLEKPGFHVEEALDFRPAGPKTVSPGQMREYYAVVRQACLSHLERIETDLALTADREAFGKRWSLADRLLGQIRHVQHHVAYVNAILTSRGARAVPWRGYNE